jgi:hypothetical protein
MRPERLDEPIEREVRVERLEGVPRRVFAGTALVVALIVVAMIKPWGDPTVRVALPAPPVRTQPASSETPVARPTPSADPALIAAEFGALCIATPSWRLITMETSELGDSRTVYAIPPVTATGPTDTSIPLTGVTAKKLLAMGVCRPSGLDDGSAEAEFGAHIWALGPDGRPVREATAILDADLYAVGEEYYAPATNQSPAPWTAGRYEVEIPNASSSGASLWFAVNFASGGGLS